MTVAGSNWRPVAIVAVEHTVGEVDRHVRKQPQSS
jgi:hypothetical protein